MEVAGGFTLCRAWREPRTVMAPTPITFRSRDGAHRSVGFKPSELERIEGTEHQIESVLGENSARQNQNGGEPSLVGGSDMASTVDGTNGNEAEQPTGPDLVDFWTVRADKVLREGLEEVAK